MIAIDYDVLHAHCQHITIYMDQKDQALGAAELINRTPSLGKHPFALVRSARDSLTGAGGVLRHLRGYDDSGHLDCRHSGSPMLDLDVIDTSWMDTNAVGPRHSYFSGECR